MKKIYLLLLMFISQVALAQHDFITRWDLSKNGPMAEPIRFGVTTTGSVSYTWQEVSPGTASGAGSFNDGTVTITGLPDGAIIDLHINPANFSAFSMEPSSDHVGLVDVRQWGTTTWTSMAYAFYSCSNLQISATDQPDLSGVTDVSNMFFGCTVLDGPANMGSWDMSNVTNMESMFDGAGAFNRPIGAWNTTSVTNMAYMFYGAGAFNRPIAAWKTENVESMYSMFYNAATFNQSIGDWTLNPAVDLNFIFTNSGLDCYYYSETLKGWRANDDTPVGLSLDAQDRTYSPGAADARDYLILTKGWTIAGDAASDAECLTIPEESKFITRWDLSGSGSGAQQISFDVTASGPVSYTWREVSPGTESGGGNFSNGSVTITNLPAGAIIDLYINPGNFKSFSMASGSDPARLIDVRQWGTTAWTSMVYAFYGCSNLQISATDLPDLSGVTGVSGMFSGCTVLNGPANIGSWDVSNVKNMYSMFEYASSFNQPIGAWNTTSVTQMGYMFFGAAAFNQPIGNWNTENVRNMSTMFYGAGSFNQPIGGWNTSGVTEMSYMFYDAGAFDQSLGNWTLNGSVGLNSIFTNSGLGCYNYSETLKGWSANPGTPNGLTLDAGGRTYSPGAAGARDNLVTSKGWTIGGDEASDTECPAGQGSPESERFVTRWDLSITGSGDAQLNFDVATSGPVSYTWTEVSPGTDTGSGTFGSGTATITGLPTGATIELSISPVNFERIMINDGPDKDRLVNVKQWGIVSWKSMGYAFNGCSNLQISASDLPDLSAVTNMKSMFQGCAVLNGPVNIGSWDTENVEDMSSMFTDAAAFNQPIGSWDTQNVTGMYGLFEGATSFNQPIGGWNIQKVEEMDSMFEDAISFNQPIGNWNTLSLIDLAEMFRGAVSFNQDISNWKTENVIAMYGMFRDAVAFNRDISSWNTGNVRSVASMFEGAVAFNQPIGSWNMQNVIHFHRTFADATAFNQPIGSWDTRNAENMSQMFVGAVAFNQPIGSWNTQKVFDMNNMFMSASAFDQSLGNWALKAAVDLGDIFTNSGLSCFNYSETLKGWRNNAGTPVGLYLNAPDRTYGLSAADARNYLLTAKGWTIEGDAASGTECSDLLPVTLVSFSGQKDNENQNVLKWATADERDFDRFEVQRSEDALSFEKIGEVYGIAANIGSAAQSTPALAEYDFTDRSPGFSNYYRLKMLDRDGSFEYSRIIVIENAGEQAVGSFYPNPSSGKVWVDVNALESGRWTLTVVDASGKNIVRRTYDLQKGKNTISLEHFADGVNLVRFEYGRLSEIRKLIRK